MDSSKEEQLSPWAIFGIIVFSIGFLLGILKIFNLI